MTCCAFTRLTNEAAQIPTRNVATRVNAGRMQRIPSTEKSKRAGIDDGGRQERRILGRNGNEAEYWHFEWPRLDLIKIANTCRCRKSKQPQRRTQGQEAIPVFFQRFTWDLTMCMHCSTDGSEIHKPKASINRGCHPSEACRINCQCKPRSQFDGPRVQTGAAYRYSGVR